MTTQNSSSLSESRLSYWRRVLRPLFWWLLLVLVLYGIRTHQLWMEKTRLNFSATLAGQIIFPEATATIDGQPIVNGQRISLGSHIFTVTHPKGETYSTNLHIWYGGQDLGAIVLKRAIGNLSVTADPPADWLVIRGPEWSVTLTNSSGLTKSVPSDQYEIQAVYPHWRKNYAVDVFANQTTPCNIAPHFGGLNLACNQSDATFQLQTTDGQLFSDGLLPVTIAGVPPGDYKIIAVHHGNQRTGMLTVSAGATNSTQIDFQYGVAVIKTSPAGVTVVAENGRNLGETPITLSEMVPGNWMFTLQRPGYQSLQVSVDLKANQTITISTNLVSETYLHALTAARQFMAAVDYDHALKAAEDALAARPGDIEATTLQREATGLGDLQRAQALGKRGDYVGGDKQLTAALQFLPGNEEIKSLLAEFKQHEPAQLEHERLERLNLGTNTFNAFVAHESEAGLFDSHILKTTKPVKEVVAAILAQMKRPPFFDILSFSTPADGAVQFEARSEIYSYLATSSGRRRCLIVAAQTRDDETQILYKILEYKTEAQIKFSIGNLIGAPGAVFYIPIDKSKASEMTEKLKAQIQTGESNVTARLQAAIGQTPAVQPAAPQ